MNIVFAKNLNKLMEQLDIQNAQLAKALNVDPSLVCRWRKEGCGKRSAPGHSIAIERFVLSRTMTAENRAWLSAQIGKPVFSGMPSGVIANWLYPDADYQIPQNADEDFPNLLLVGSFRSSVVSPSADTAQDDIPALSACDGSVSVGDETWPKENDILDNRNVEELLGKFALVLPKEADERDAFTVVKDDGQTISGKTFTNPVTITCDKDKTTDDFGGDIKFRNCEFSVPDCAVFLGLADVNGVTFTVKQGNNVLTGKTVRYDNAGKTNTDNEFNGTAVKTHLEKDSGNAWITEPGNISLAVTVAKGCTVEYDKLWWKDSTVVDQAVTG